MSQGLRRMIVLVTMMVACAGLCACPPKEPPPRVHPGRGDTSRDTQLRTDDLARELELAILDNYLQLSVGNVETYADSIARDRQVMLMGIGPEQIFFGQNPAPGLAAVDRRPFRERPRCMPGTRVPEECVEVVSKRLDIHLYLDDSVGWLSDEISYRIPFGGRQAAVPLQITAVFVRDIDLWVMVAEQLSYGLSFEDIVALAKAGELARPASFPTRYPPGNRNEMRLFTSSTLDWLNRDQGPKARNKLDHSRERARLSEDKKQALIDKDKLLGDELFYMLMPDPRFESQGNRVFQAEPLAQFFGAGATVTINDYQLDLADNRRVAWMTANLTALVPNGAGPKLRVGLRGLFLYALDVNGWNLLHSHISVPVTEAQLAQRVFGKLPEPTLPPIIDGGMGGGIGGGSSDSAAGGDSR